MKRILLLLTFSWFLFLCFGSDGYELSVPQESTSIQWYVSENFDDDFSVISGATNTVYQATSPGIYYAVFTLQGCHNHSSYFVLTSVSTSTVPTFSYPINLVAPVGSDSYQWYSNGTSISGSTGSTYQVNGDGTYSVRSQRGHCPSMSPTFIFRSLGVSLIVKDSTYVVDSLVGSDHTVSSNVVIDNGLSPNVNYTVSLLEDVQEGDLSFDEDGSFTYSVSKFISGLDSFKYIVCLDHVCDTATVYLDYSCAFSASDLEVPNLLSPNNDGHNDLWEVSGLLNYKTCYTYNEVIIFNRWEAKVYSKKDYGLDGSWWDGRSDRKSVILSRDALLPPGTYFYYIVIDGNVDKGVTGFLHIQY